MHQILRHRISIVFWFTGILLGHSQPKVWYEFIWILKKSFNSFRMNIKNFVQFFVTIYQFSNVLIIFWHYHNAKSLFLRSLILLIFGPSRSVIGTIPPRWNKCPQNKKYTNITCLNLSTVRHQFSTEVSIKFSTVGHALYFGLTIRPDRLFEEEFCTMDADFAAVVCLSKSPRSPLTAALPP